MSIQMSFIFLCLVFEMVLISLLVLPLPFQIRKVVVQVSDYLFNSTHFRVIIGFLAFIVSLLFLDSLKRSTVHYHTSRHHHHHGEEPIYLNSYELATRNYNQRNMYITGLVLYLGLCVPTAVSILKKLIKHKNKYDNALKNPVADSAKIEELQKQLSSKNLNIQTMKKQINNLTEAYNKIADENKSGVKVDKKND